MSSEPPEHTTSGPATPLLGQLAGRVGLEFEHLFARLAEHLERLDDVAGDRAEVADELADSRQLLTRGRALIEQLVAFGGERNLAPTRHDLRALVGRWWPQLQSIVGPRHPLELYLRGAPVAEIDTDQLALALANLCSNARDASPPGAAIELHVTDRELDGEVVIELVDHGRGMPAELSARALEPFFSTKPRHTGLGLPAAAAIIEAHGGRLTLHSEPDTGTRVSIRLPSAPSQTEASMPAHARVRVLVIDPERLIARWMQRSLTSKGCDVRVAADVLAAREQLRDDWAELIVLDRNLPDGDGRNFALELALDRPERPLLFASSRTQLRRDRDRGLAPLPEHVHILDKPYSTRRFDALVSTTLGELRARRAASA